MISILRADLDRVGHQFCRFLSRDTDDIVVGHTELNRRRVRVCESDLVAELSTYALLPFEKASVETEMVDREKQASVHEDIFAPRAWIRWKDNEGEGEEVDPTLARRLTDDQPFVRW